MADGHTDFVSSHLLTEVEHLVDDVVIIHQGGLVTSGALGELQQPASLVRTPSSESLEKVLTAAGGGVQSRDATSSGIRPVWQDARMSSSGAMTTTEREAFLADVHVGVLAVDEEGRGPLALPIWYQYRDGTIVIHMSDSSRKANLLRSAGRATLTVQSEAPPYKYVSVEGPVSVGPATGDDLEMAVRYLGAELGAWYAEQNPPTDDSATVTLTPEHWRTYDFAKLLP